MQTEPIELEGTWEEIVKHSNEFVGRRVRLMVLPDQPANENGEDEFSTANSLLQYAGTWVGDDLEERLQEVYETRSQVHF